MSDEINSLFHTARFLKAQADMETGRDEPEPHQRNRDQVMNRADLFKVRVLAALWNEQAQWDRLKRMGHSAGLCDLASGAIDDCIRRVRELKP